MINVENTSTARSQRVARNRARMSPNCGIVVRRKIDAQFEMDKVLIRAFRVHLLAIRASEPLDENPESSSLVNQFSV